MNFHLIISLIIANLIFNFKFSNKKEINSIINSNGGWRDSYEYE